MKEKIRLTKSEWEIMNVIWDTREALTSSEIIKYRILIIVEIWKLYGGIYRRVYNTGLLYVFEMNIKGKLNYI